MALPGIAQIISCVPAVVWELRNGVNCYDVIDKVVGIIVECIGVPFAAHWLTKALRMIVWTNRAKLAAAFSAIGLADLALIAHTSPRPR